MTAGLQAEDYDIAIVGAGLSGTIAATVLGRAGYRVVLIDRHEAFPPEFRVEKIGGDQVEKFRRLGLLDAVAEAAMRFDEIVNIRRGRLLDRTRATHYGILYDELVRAMRAELPSSVRLVFGQVGDLATGPERQQVTIGKQGVVSARLVVLATGMGDVLRSRLGIEREVIHARQSLTFGFNLQPVGAPAFARPALTHYGERPADGIDYLNIFPAGGTTRANLFTFREHTDPWVRAFRQAPRRVLAETLPGLLDALGDFEITDRVQMWLQDLAVARGVERDGVVLIGDAFQTSCPAAGTGVSRLLTDIERLCLVHIPQWLASPGMSAEKIARFYADPQKRAMDDHVLALARYRRRLTVDTSPAWRLQRQVLYTRRRLIDRLDRVSPGLVARLRSLKARPA